MEQVTQHVNSTNVTLHREDNDHERKRFNKDVKELQNCFEVLIFVFTLALLDKGLKKLDINLLILFNGTEVRIDLH